MQLRAEAGLKKSVPSIKVSFGKDVQFITGKLYGPYPVNRIVDGDTITAVVEGAETKIRMIGVNTPESVATGSAAAKNCQEGKDASNYTKAQLSNQQIYLEFDTDIYDKFNRYLCYVYNYGDITPDKDNPDLNYMYNAELVSEGYAEAKYYSPNGAHRIYLDGRQATAEANLVRN